MHCQRWDAWSLKKNKKTSSKWWKLNADSAIFQEYPENSVGNATRIYGIPWSTIIFVESEKYRPWKLKSDYNG